MRRDDLTAQIPDFIALAEERIFRDLRTWRMEATASLSVTSGTRTVSLPTRFRSAIWARLETATPRMLGYLHPAGQDDLYRDFTGIPETYSYQGDALRLAPIPTADYTLTLQYIQAPSALGASNATNAVLTAYPSLYLNAAMVEAWGYVRNMEEMQKWEARYQQALTLANRESVKRKMSGIASGKQSIRRNIP